MLRIWSMNFCSLTTRGHLLTTWTLALHYCCTSSDYSSHHANTANACPGDQNVNPDQLVTTPSDPVSLAKPHMPVRSMPLGPQHVPRPSSQQKPVSLPSFCKKHLFRGPETSANSLHCNVKYCQERMVYRPFQSQPNTGQRRVWLCLSGQGTWEQYGCGNQNTL